MTPGGSAPTANSCAPSMRELRLGGGVPAQLTAATVAVEASGWGILGYFRWTDT